jgi:hypothetical protein
MTKETKYRTTEGTWYIAYNEDNSNFIYGQAGKHCCSALENFEVFGTEESMLERINILNPSLVEHLKEEEEVDPASTGERPYFRSVDTDRINTSEQ